MSKKQYPSREMPSKPESEKPKGKGDWITAAVLISFILVFCYMSFWIMRANEQKWEATKAAEYANYSIDKMIELRCDTDAMWQACKDNTFDCRIIKRIKALQEADAQQ